MRHFIVLPVILFGVIALSGCMQNQGERSAEKSLQGLDVIDDNNLSEIMLTVGDPNEAVTYFTQATQKKPDRIDLQRGLAQSLVRAKQQSNAVLAWQRVVDHPDATNEDRVGLADAQIRAGQWAEAQATLNGIPPTFETFDRYRLEAMVADSKKQWKRADSFYETAVGLTTTPAGVLNNWGFSKLTRGDYEEAERLFADAVRQNKSLFTAKNNLILARGAQRKYSLPVIPMTQTERAQLLYTLGLSAVKQGDVETGKNLLRDAVEVHPQHFDEAVRALRALENG